jgi:hypothetical protein
MDWIKRNLYFLIGSAVALALMGAAGWFLYSKWQLNNEIFEKLNQDYAELERLNKQKPHPRSGQVNNIALAKEQQQQLREFIKKSRTHFERISPIPDLPKITDRDFSPALSRTISQLQRDATNASVILPPDYNFSFQAQKQKVSFAAGSLELLAVQLGEVKTISEILFQAKINSLDNIRRERVSADDTSGPQTDYLPEKSVTNDLAVLTPYELTFRCFSSELASVLVGFGASPHALLVKTLNVEPGPAVAAVDTTSQPTPYAYTPPPPVANPGGPGGELAASGAAAMMRRYGLRPGGPGGGGLGGIPLRVPGESPVAPAPVPQQYAPTAPVAHGGLPTVLDEKQLKVTIMLNLVKLLPPKEKDK